MEFFFSFFRELVGLGVLWIGVRVWVWVDLMGLV